METGKFGKKDIQAPIKTIIALYTSDLKRYMRKCEPKDTLYKQNGSNIDNSCPETFRLVLVLENPT